MLESNSSGDGNLVRRREVQLLNTGIAWESDKENKFKNPDGDLAEGKGVSYHYLAKRRRKRSIFSSFAPHCPPARLAPRPVGA